MRIEEMLELVRSGADVEAAREDVTDEHLAPLAAAFPTLDWKQRLTLVHLVQDTISPITRPLMQEFLSFSPDVITNRDSTEVARAIALCHLEGTLQNFEQYLDDTSQVERHRRTAQ